MTEFWGAIIAAATFATVVIGAVWGVMQAQFRAVAEARAVKEKCLDDDLEAIARRIDSLESTRISALEGRIISRDTFDEYKEGTRDMIAVLRAQLVALETSRPTTGELQKAANSLEGKTDKIEERVRSLEQRFNLPIPGSVK